VGEYIAEHLCLCVSVYRCGPGGKCVAIACFSTCWRCTTGSLIKGRVARECRILCV
jgi:hypothetical protein